MRDLIYEDRLFKGCISRTQTPEESATTITAYCSTLSKEEAIIAREAITARLRAHNDSFGIPSWEEILAEN